MKKETIYKGTIEKKSAARRTAATKTVAKRTIAIAAAAAVVFTGAAFYTPAVATQGQPSGAGGIVVTAQGQQSVLDGIVVTAQAAETYSLTVNVSGDASALTAANTVIDLYKIADASGTPGTSVFAWTQAAGFDKLTIDDTDWAATAQNALSIALTSADGKTTANVTATKEAQPIGAKISLTDAGLYLIVPHGSDLTDYLSGGAAIDGGATADGTTAATIARTSDAQFTFTPQIVALPGKDGENALTDGSGTWSNDVSIVLKYSKSDLFGKLKLTKTLNTFETKDPATFVFRVDGYSDEAKTNRVYSDVVSIVFNGAGIRSTELTDVPIGAYVTATEIYSGAVYQISGSKTAETQITEDGTAEVSFTNDYGKNKRGGGSVTNKFSFHKNENKWPNPTQVYDTTATGTKEK